MSCPPAFSRPWQDENSKSLADDGILAQPRRGQPSHGFLFSLETPGVHRARRGGSRVAARGERAAGRKAAPVGVMASGTVADTSHLTAAFVQRLRELGWIEGRNVAI